MAIYKNCSNTTKTFYGVTFQPGEVHKVVGYIHHPKFVRLNELPKDETEKPRTKSCAKPKTDAKPVKTVVDEPKTEDPELTETHKNNENIEEVIPNGEHKDQ